MQPRKDEGAGRAGRSLRPIRFMAVTGRGADRAGLPENYEAGVIRYFGRKGGIYFQRLL